MPDQIPAYTELFNPLLSALKALGGSARPAEANAQIIEDLGLSDEQVEQESDTGVPLLYNRIAWARYYLVQADLIDSSKRGVWTLTDLGRETDELSAAQVEDIRRKVAAARREVARDSSEDDEAADASAPTDEAEAASSDHREAVRELLRSISAAGFERFCQRLLRESGFERVEVTGRSGDGGIDGHGLLRVNPLVSFSVIFQSKRYQTPVGSPQIRDFRGAMSGRADRGLMITTSSFTRDAVREANRDGATQIELIDADGIIDLLEELELGLTPVRSYRVERDFFEDFAD